MCRIVIGTFSIGSLGCPVLRLENGSPSVAHALINLGATLSVAKAVQVLKANSSRWMNEQSRTFEWQEGYFACSVSRSQVPGVTRYIANQKGHHKRMDSLAEFLLILRKHGFEALERM